MAIFEARRSYDLTPSDDNDVAAVGGKVHVNDSGEVNLNLVLVNDADNTGRVYTVTGPATLNFVVKRVKATNTTATDMILITGA